MKRNVIKLPALVNNLSKYDFTDQYVEEYILKKPLIVFKCVFYCFVVSMYELILSFNSILVLCSLM